MAGPLRPAPSSAGALRRAVDATPLHPGGGRFIPSLRRELARIRGGTGTGRSWSPASVVERHGQRMPFDDPEGSPRREELPAHVGARIEMPQRAREPKRQ